MKNILFVHQSADMYGSDRVLLALVIRLNREKFHPIVILPFDGPLSRELEAAGIECHVLPVTRLSRATLSLRGVFRFPGSLLKSLRAFDSLLAGRDIELVHSNTLAVFTGAVWARLRHIKHVWHVHEIIQHPVFVRKVYAYLVNWFSDKVVCVSHATARNLLLDKPELASRIEVVWNGLSRGAMSDGNDVCQFRQQAGAGKDDVLIALVGRINRLKGQRLLVDAVGQLWHQGILNLRVVFVGSVVPGQEHFEEALRKAIADSPARESFKLCPFMRNVWLVWDACDIAVIPSTEPESFGLVALEAMAASKPVIASRLGGLQEIVCEGTTGLLTTPGDACSLAGAIKQLAENARLRQQMGEAGKQRLQTEFSLLRFIERMVVVYKGIINPTSN